MSELKDCEFECDVELVDDIWLMDEKLMLVVAKLHIAVSSVVTDKVTVTVDVPELDALIAVTVGAKVSETSIVNMPETFGFWLKVIFTVMFPEAVGVKLIIPSFVILNNVELSEKVTLSPSKSV